MRELPTPPFSISSLQEGPEALVLQSTLVKKQNIDFSHDIFHEQNFTLNKYLEGRSALFVLSESIYELYGEKITRFLQLRKRFFGSHLIVVRAGEHHKVLDTVAQICQAASDFSLARHHPIVGVGGGICLDECGLAAALFRRCVPHIKIPTTLVGLIDAGIATKNGVNLGKKKNLLGTFYPPEATIIDPFFLQTLPKRQIICGTAESIKMGLVVEKNLYTLWQSVGQELISSRFQHPEMQALEVIKLSIVSMLRELSANLYEHNCYRRAVDFGHSFSQYIEQVSDYKILHGEAVAIDMAISCQISYLQGLISENLLNEIMDLFQLLELPCYHSCVDVDELWDSLSPVIAHRGGNLNLVLPKAIGECLFVENLRDLSKSCVKEALVRLEKSYENRGYAMVS